MLFTDDGKLVASLSDKTIHLWESSSENLAEMICKIVRRDMTPVEWNNCVGTEVPYEKTCGKNP